MERFSFVSVNNALGEVGFRPILPINFNWFRGSAWERVNGINYLIRDPNDRELNNLQF
ncbi:hypothetical protein QUB68_00020 [Microcoleus sp. A006_D1]|uniref:hypothetical protein n=1 Tax=Microcoleus sp. A006_D1 TaxID=3055267 RepID=UPI002FD3AF20